MQSRDAVPQPPSWPVTLRSSGSRLKPTAWWWWAVWNPRSLWDNWDRDMAFAMNLEENKATAGAAAPCHRMNYALQERGWCSVLIHANRNLAPCIWSLCTKSLVIGCRCSSSTSAWRGETGSWPGARLLQQQEKQSAQVWAELNTSQLAYRNTVVLQTLLGFLYVFSQRTLSLAFPCFCKNA